MFYVTIKKEKKKILKLTSIFLCRAYSLPGAKLKNVVTRGIGFVKDFAEEDFIIVLAGTNDVHPNEPAQLTIAKRLNMLFLLDKRTNVFLSHIPYGYDDFFINNNKYLFLQSIDIKNGPQLQWSTQYYLKRSTRYLGGLISQDMVPTSAVKENTSLGNIFVPPSKTSVGFLQVHRVPLGVMSRCLQLHLQLLNPRNAEIRPKHLNILWTLHCWMAS